ncbi:MAG: 3D-(3,5/4)-trihydroxycyclohexane-1,2-dione acylhydrolase (decyclizing) [Clostridium sp.]
MKKVRLTTAQALVRFLSNQYVSFDGKEERFIEGIFTIFGHGNVVGLGQALEENPEALKVYQGRNEQGMAHAAVAYGKQNNRKKILACTSSVGPGAANMITAAATATANNIPVLLLPGDTFSTRQPDPVLQQIEQFHNAGISTNDAFKPVCKYFDRVSRPEQLMSAMVNAMRVLTDVENTGAVCVALPQDVQGESYDFPEYFFKKRVHKIERRVPCNEDIIEAASLIKGKKKPMIICGGGVKYSEASKALISFSERFNIPICETQAGKSAIRSSHPLNLGGVGVTGNLAANSIAREADLVIGVGTRFTDFTSGSKSLWKNEEVEFVNINASRFHALKMDGVSVVSDCKMGLEALEKALEELNYKSSYNKEIRIAKEEWKKELDRLEGIEYKENFIPEVKGHNDDVSKEFYDFTNGIALPQTVVVKEINNLLKENSIVVGAAGSLPGDMQRVWESEEVDSYHMEYGYSCMGYEISGALGVKLAKPEKEVYALVGDGSFQMLHSELITSLQERKKINVILLDNGGFGCINNLQMGNGMGSFGTEFRYRNEATGLMDGSFMNIDYSKVGEGYGLKSYSVRSLKELREAINDSKLQEKSTLIEVKVMPKTMTNGYDSWWHVGIASTTAEGYKGEDKVKKAYEDKEFNLSNAREY